jgi:hypothetical protein
MAVCRPTALAAATASGSTRFALSARLTAHNAFYRELRAPSSAANDLWVAQIGTEQTPFYICQVQWLKLYTCFNRFFKIGPPCSAK